MEKYRMKTNVYTEARQAYTDLITEKKWIKVNPAEKGKYKGWTIAELKDAKAKLLKANKIYKQKKQKVPQSHKEKMAELNFAIRAKQTHGFRESTNSDNPKTMTAVAYLTKMFPGIIGIQDGYRWSGNQNSYRDSIHLGDAAEGGEIDGEAAADYGMQYIHPKLEQELENLGYYADWYDAGTLIAFPS
jgi:hypothetical protein